MSASFAMAIPFDTKFVELQNALRMSARKRCRRGSTDLVVGGGCTRVSE